MQHISHMFSSVSPSASRTAVRLLVAGFLLCLSSGLAAQVLTSSVDRNQIRDNETLALAIRLDQQVSGAPDLSALEQDWQILNQGTQTGLQIVNGQSSAHTTWNLSLLPKRTGTLAIPSFRWDNAISDAIEIEVSRAGAGSSSGVTADLPMRVSASLDKDQVYEGEQILLTVSLEAQANVSGISGDAPTVGNAELILLDRVTRSRIDNGIQTQVVDWVYAVYPPSAGTLTIPSQLFSGTVGSSDPFDSLFNRNLSPARRVAARTSALTVEILPRPAGSPNGSWFNADDVSISASWQGDSDQLRVGEPITRSILIEAQGQRAAAIPEIEYPTGDFKIYPDQPQLGDVTSPQGLVGRVQLSSALVANRAGLLELPEIRIPWWDNGSDSWKEAVLPAETLEVLPALNSTGSVPDSPSSVDQSLAGTGAISELSGSTDQAPGLYNLLAHPAWFWSTLILALLVLVQFRRLQQRPVRVEVKGSTDNPSLKVLERELRQVCSSRDASVFRESLLEWARARFPRLQLNSISDVKSLLGNTRLNTELTKLDRQLYSGDGESIDWSVIEQELELLLRYRDSKKQVAAALPGLYPASSS